MKLLDRIILGVFSVLMLLISIFSCLVIFGWLDATVLFLFLTKLLETQTACNAIIGINIFIIILAIKTIFFESTAKEEINENTYGILLQNEDGKLLITKETLKNMVDSQVQGFEGVKSSQTKIILDKNNDLSIILTIDVTENVVIKELSNNIQIKVKDTIKKSIDVDVKSLDIKIRNIISLEETKE